MSEDDEKEAVSNEATVTDPVVATTLRSAVTDFIQVDSAKPKKIVSPATTATISVEADNSNTWSRYEDTQGSVDWNKVCPFACVTFVFRT